MKVPPVGGPPPVFGAVRAFLWLFLAALLVYGGLLSALSRGGFPGGLSTPWGWPHLVDKPIGEDGYYMLTVAWHLGQGDGFSYNGPAPTSGVQPLYTAVLGGLAALVQAAGGDRWTFARATLVLGTLNLLMFALLAGQVAARLSDDPKTASLASLLTSWMAAASFWVFRSFTYGLETGLYLILLSLLVGLTLEIANWNRIPFGKLLTLGVLCALAGLTRLDFGVAMAAVFGLFFLIKGMRFWAVALVGATAAAGVSPWLWYVHKVTGGVLPSSGGAQVASVFAEGDVWRRAKAMLGALAEHLSPWAYTGGRPALTVVALVTVVAFLLWARPRLGALDPAKRKTLLCWLGAFALLAANYFTFFWATHFYDRYTAPLLVLTLPLFGLWAAQRLVNASKALQIAFCAALAASFAVCASVSLHMGRIGNTHAVTAGFVARVVPAELKVGAFQSGVVGFFNPNVVNLDGKVDSRALEYASQGRLSDYIDEQGIDVLVDWEDLLEDSLPPDYRSLHWEPCPAVIGNGVSACLVRRGRGDLLRPHRPREVGK